MSTEHNADYAVYEDSDSCKCPKPNDEDQGAVDAYDDKHPHGEGINGDVDICRASPMGTFCQECSHEQGDWVGHLIFCAECGYSEDSCDCTTEGSPDDRA